MCDVAVSTAQNSCTVAILRAHSSVGSAEMPLRLRETWDSDSGWWHERTHRTVVVVEVVVVSWWMG